MIFLNDFFKSAPKKYLAQLFKKKNSYTGVVQGKKVIEKILEWAGDENRLKKILENLDDSEKFLLLAIYISEKRGLLESDMYSLSNDMNPGKISDTLFKLEDEVLIFCRRGDYYSFHGFADFFGFIVEQLLPGTLDQVENNNSWISNVSHMIPHTLKLMSHIQLGHVKCTQKGEFHRRSINLILEKITSGEILSPNVADLELEMNFQFLIDNKFILEDRGTVLLSADARQFLKNSARGIHRSLFDWWAKKRLCDSKGTLKLLNSSMTKGIAVESFVKLFRPFSPGGSRAANTGTDSPGLTWDQLPSTLKELWILGGIEFAMSGGKITSVKISKKIKELTHEQNTEEPSVVPEKAYSLPNFEILLPFTTEPEIRFQIECLADRQNDENMVTYRFSKESVVQGLQSGILFRELQGCLELLKFDENSTNAITEWAGTYESSEFREVLLLKIKGGDHFSALNNIPQFLNLTDETIPGYGFIIPKKNKPGVTLFLKQFGLTPGDSSILRRSKTTGPIRQEYVKLFSSYFPPGDVHYNTEQKARYIFKNKTGQKKYDTQGKSPTQSDMLRIVEYAILTDKKLELSNMTQDKKRTLIRPLHLLKDSDPITLIATDIHSGARGEYLMNTVTSLRIIE